MHDEVMYTDRGREREKQASQRERNNESVADVITGDFRRGGMFGTGVIMSETRHLARVSQCNPN